jgi:malate dehydrogenase (oxaloacetate-decarboxylating)(NADP+)
MFDSNGLLESTRGGLSEQQQKYAHAADPSRDFVASIERLKPTILIGASTRGGAFDRAVITSMSALNQRPIIFALSNPTDKAECTAEQAYTWSGGKALFAAGVQFPKVTLDGQTHLPGQANNIYVFPAIGLATWAARPTRLTEGCFLAAAEAIADQVDPEERARGMLFPSQRDIFSTEVTTAVRVAEFMFDRGLAQVPRPDDLRAWLEGLLYEPTYGLATASSSGAIG